MPDMKPILFSTNMVRAILDNRKTVTRRVVKPQPLWRKPPIQQSGRPEYWANWDDEKIYKSPYRPGDTLYVRETFWPGVAGVYEYKADYEDNPGYAWKPSIHMPREASRIFLRVTGVRVERLQDISMKDVRNEGIEYDIERPVASYGKFVELWDSTIRPGIRALYGWGGNPWVWVIEFERCQKPETAP